MSARLSLLLCLALFSFSSVESRDFLQVNRSRDGAGSKSIPAFHETLNEFYSNGTGLIVSMMHHGFEADSLAKGVPVWACPAGDHNCTWHAGKYYASATWISWHLYGPLGVELYQCNPNGCSTVNLLLIYNPSTTVVGAAFLADANTDADARGMEGCSTSFTPPTCSEVAQVCAALKPANAESNWMASCLGQAGGDVGKPYLDEFSDAYGGVLEGTLMPYGLVDTPSNFTRFVAMQKESFTIFPNESAFHSDCAPDNAQANCTCNSGGFGYNELPVRTANPQLLCIDGKCNVTEYKQAYCENQLPIALAYVAGDQDEPWDSNDKPNFYEHYVAQIEEICGTRLPLVRFNFRNRGMQPFVAFDAWV